MMLIYGEKLRGRMLIVCQILALISMQGCIFKHHAIIQFNADQLLNLDSKRQSFPVLVKYYQLLEQRIFQDATFEQLWKYDQNILGQHLLHAGTVTIFPKTVTKKRISLEPGAKYIGIVAIFMDPSNNSWKSIKAIPLLFKQRKISASLKNNQLKIENTKKV